MFIKIIELTIRYVPGFFSSRFLGFESDGIFLRSIIHKPILSTRKVGVPRVPGYLVRGSVGQIHKVAVMTGIPATMLTANVNMDGLLRVLTAAITMTT